MEDEPINLIGCDTIVNSPSFHQLSVGETLKSIGENGAEEFYTGATATAQVDDIQQRGGIITREDLRNYKVSWEAPVEADIPHTDTLWKCSTTC